jgi:uncharacterized YceG family protein
MSDRTPEEREQARREREAKRIKKTGEIPAIPPVPADEVGRVPQEREETPVQFEEAAAHFEQDAAEFDDPPGRFEQKPADLPDMSSRRPDPPPAAERPLGVRRAGTPRVRDLPNVGNAYQRYKNKPRGVPSSRRGMRRVGPIAALIVFFVFAWFLVSLFQPLKGDGEGAVAVTIPSGSSTGDIADLLADQDVISSTFFFSLRMRLAGKSLQSGSFQMKRGMSYGTAIEQLSSAPATPPVVKVVVPEGKSRGEIAAIATKAGLTGSYTSVSKRSSKLRPRSYGAPKSATLEGFLFPATYELEPGSSAKALVSKQLDAFKQNFDDLSFAPAKRRNLTRYDILIVASMIEREATIPSERSKIAAVIYNRLRQGIPLGIDATIRFALNNWTRPLKVSELESDTPYNTRKREGLPPGPIGNPGLASIKAALRPASVNYVFYVVKPCGKGAHAFSSTDAQFQKDVAAYNKARDAKGGNDPSNC